MPKPRKLYIDQHRCMYWARTLKELRAQCGGRCAKMYIDRDGVAYDIGYVIGELWLERFIPDRKPAKF